MKAMSLSHGEVIRDLAVLFHKVAAEMSPTLIVVLENSCRPKSGTTLFQVAASYASH